MSHKRQPDDFKANPSHDKRRKLPSLKNVILEVMSLRKVQLCMEPVLEPLIRKVVKEEVELALRKYLSNMKWSIGKEIESSESRSLQLQFLPKISLPIFTGSRIEGEDCNTLKVALVDNLTGQIVYSGLESSAKVEIVVLEGDFDGDEGGNWTLEEFNNNIVRERVGKKPLLTGDLLFALEEGIGLVGEIYFTDNSSWTRSRKFRLGARVVDSFKGVRVREAKTESFIVRDHRGELYKKHHPPSLHDEVWRLEKIGKEGAFHKRLNREKVNSVKDFLILLNLDPTRLRNILGMGMSTKMWEFTVEHAQTCILDHRLYFYCPGSQQKTGVVFSVVGQVMGLLSDCQYIPLDKLSETEKEEAHNMVIAAFTNWEKVVSFDDEASLINASGRLFSYTTCANSADIKVLTSQKIGEFDYPQTSLCSPDTMPADIEVLTPQKIDEFNYPQTSLCSPDTMPSVYSMGHLNILDDFGLHDIDHLDLSYDETINFNGQVTNSLFCEPEDDRLQYFGADCSFQSGNSRFESDLHSAVNGFLLPRSAAFAQRRWAMVFSVLKWFSIRKIVAKKTNVRRKQRIF